jgi:hypothetical protein
MTAMAAPFALTSKWFHSPPGREQAPGRREPINGSGQMEETAKLLNFGIEPGPSNRQPVRFVVVRRSQLSDILPLSMEIPDGVL